MRQQTNGRHDGHRMVGDQWARTYDSPDEQVGAFLVSRGNILSFRLVWMKFGNMQKDIGFTLANIPPTLRT